MKPTKATKNRLAVPGRCMSRTPGWILARVLTTDEDGRSRDAQEALDTIAHHPWAHDARYLGIARGMHLFERPGPGVVAPAGNTGRVPAFQSPDPKRSA